MRIIGLIFGWLSSLLALAVATYAALYALGVANGPEGVETPDLKIWPLVGAAAAIVFAAVVNPLSAAAIGFKDKWVRTSIVVVLTIGIGLVSCYMHYQQQYSPHAAAARQRLESEAQAGHTLADRPCGAEPMDLALERSGMFGGVGYFARGYPINTDLADTLGLEAPPAAFTVCETVDDLTLGAGLIAAAPSEDAGPFAQTLSVFIEGDVADGTFSIIARTPEMELVSPQMQALAEGFEANDAPTFVVLLEGDTIPVQPNPVGFLFIRQRDIEDRIVGHWIGSLDGAPADGFIGLMHDQAPPLWVEVRAPNGDLIARGAIEPANLGAAYAEAQASGAEMLRMAQEFDVN